MKRLTSLVLAGALSLSLAGCDYSSPSPSRHEYNGKIGKEHVKFEEKKYWIWPKANILTVQKSEKLSIIYSDVDGNDLNLDYIEIIKNGKITKYTLDDTVGKVVLKEAQKSFENYLQKIENAKNIEKEAKIKQELKNTENIEVEIKEILEDLK